MLVLRFLALLVLAAIAATFVAWLLTGQARYLQWAKRLGLFSVLAGGLVVLMLVGERLIAH